MDEICVGDRNRKKEEIHTRTSQKYKEKNIHRFIFLYLEITRQSFKTQKLVES